MKERGPERTGPLLLAARPSSAEGQRGAKVFDIAFQEVVTLQERLGRAAALSASWVRAPPRTGRLLSQRVGVPATRVRELSGLTNHHGGSTSEQRVRVGAMSA